MAIEEIISDVHRNLRRTGQLIERQQQIIRQMEEQGRPCDLARQLLTSYLITQTQQKTHLLLLQKEADLIRQEA